MTERQFTVMADLPQHPEGLRAGRAVYLTSLVSTRRHQNKHRVIQTHNPVVFQTTTCESVVMTFHVNSSGNGISLHH